MCAAELIATVLCFNVQLCLWVNVGQARTLKLEWANMVTVGDMHWDVCEMGKVGETTTRLRALLQPMCDVGRRPAFRSGCGARRGQQPSWVTKEGGWSTAELELRTSARARVSASVLLEFHRFRHDAYAVLYS